jgi:hypothetical protein
MVAAKHPYPAVAPALSEEGVAAAVGASVIDHDDLARYGPCRQDRLDGVNESVALVENGDHHRRTSGLSHPQGW